AMAADGAQIRQVLGGILDAKYRMRPATAHPSSAKKFGGAMAQESKTFMGMMGNLADQWARFRNLVMASGLFDWLTGRLGRLLDTLDRMAASGSLQRIAEQVGKRLVDAFKAAEAAVEWAWPWIKKLALGLDWIAGKMGGWGNMAGVFTGLYLTKKATGASCREGIAELNQCVAALRRGRREAI
ncbi:MAG: hypothetical protein OXH92_08615, partial [Bryobacterales bacterium]|nr:hypothetical protein [Bryobacterales bacterium]